MPNAVGIVTVHIVVNSDQSGVGLLGQITGTHTCDYVNIWVMFSWCADVYNLVEWSCTNLSQMIISIIYYPSERSERSYDAEYKHLCHALIYSCLYLSYINLLYYDWSYIGDHLSNVIFGGFNLLQLQPDYLTKKKDHVLFMHGIVLTPPAPSDHDNPVEKWLGCLYDFSGIYWWLNFGYILLIWTFAEWF